MSMNNFKILSEKPAATIISASMIERRMDAGCFQPTYLKNESNLLNGSVPYSRLGSLYNKGNYGSLPDSVDYATEGVALIRGTDLQSMAIDLSEAVRVPEHYYDQFKKAQITPGDILMLVKGASIDRPDSVAMFPETDDKAIANGSVFIIRAKESKVNSKYLLAVMTSGAFLLQKRRGSSNTGALYNDLDTIKAFIIPLPNQRIQKYIGKKVELAEKCREEATKNRNIVNELFESILHERKFHSNNAQTRFVPPDDLTTEWLNSNFYRQIYKDLLIDLDTNGVPLVPLGEYGVCSRQKERPKGDIFYIEISDIDNFNGIISGGRNCSPENTPNNAQRTITKSDILMSTRRPDRGAVAYVEDNIDNAFCSVFLAKIQTHEKSHSRFIHEYLRTYTAKLFIGQRCTVTTYPVISEDDIETIPVPVVSPELIAEISEASKKASLYKKFADQLVVEAKSNVEALIEGKLDTDAILSGKLKAPTMEDIEKELEDI